MTQPQNEYDAPISEALEHLRFAVRHPKTQEWLYDLGAEEAAQTILMADWTMHTLVELAEEADGSWIIRIEDTFINDDGDWENETYIAFQGATKEETLRHIMEPLLGDTILIQNAELTPAPRSAHVYNGGSSEEPSLS